MSEILRPAPEGALDWSPAEARELGDQALDIWTELLERLHDDLPVARNRSAADVADAVKKAGKLGVRVHEPVTVVENYGRFAVISDPQGATIMLIEPGEKPIGRTTPHVNIGYEISSGRSELDNLRYTVGFDTYFHPRLTFALGAVGVYQPNVEDIGNHKVDLAAGVRVKLWESLIVNSIVQVPMNRSTGLRPDYTWSVGLDYSFGGE